MPNHKIIYINPGPRYNLNDNSFKLRWEYLSSKGFSGYIFTTAELGGEIDIVNFKMKFIKYDSVLVKLHFFIYCLIQALKIRNSNEKIDLISSYDPLRSGFTGYLVSKILKSKFAPEINGVYTSPFVWQDGKSTKMAHFKRKFTIALMFNVLKRSDGIKLLYPTQLEPFKEDLKIKRIVSFHDYTDVSNFKEQEGRKEILFIGFPFYLKGIDILIRAFKLVSSEFTDWSLRILGWFPDPSDLVKEIDRHPNIILNKPVDHSLIPQIIGNCSILVLPSRSEAMGRVLLEAMAAGKPVIGSDVDGIPFIIKNNVNGFLFKSEDIEDLADKMRMLIDNKIIRQRMGQAGRQLALNSFSETEYFRKLIKFYRDVIKN